MTQVFPHMPTTVRLFMPPNTLPPTPPPPALSLPLSCTSTNSVWAYVMCVCTLCGLCVCVCVCVCVRERDKERERVSAIHSSVSVCVYVLWGESSVILVCNIASLIWGHKADLDAAAKAVAHLSRNQFLLRLKTSCLINAKKPPPPPPPPPKKKTQTNKNKAKNKMIKMKPIFKKTYLAKHEARVFLVGQPRKSL